MATQTLFVGWLTWRVVVNSLITDTVTTKMMMNRMNWLGWNIYCPFFVLSGLVLRILIPKCSLFHSYGCLLKFQRPARVLCLSFISFSLWTHSSTSRQFKISSCNQFGIPFASLRLLFIILCPPSIVCCFCYWMAVWIGKQHNRIHWEPFEAPVWASTQITGAVVDW